MVLKTVESAVPPDITLPTSTLTSELRPASGARTLVKPRSRPPGASPARPRPRLARRREPLFHRLFAHGARGLQSLAALELELRALEAGRRALQLGARPLGLGFEGALVDGEQQLIFRDHLAFGEMHGF
jgi:hypothetical protein